MTTGSRIKDRRKSLNMNAETLAAACGVSPATMYRYENGGIENMGVDKLEPIARALRTSIAYLLGWSDDPNAEGSLSDYATPAGLSAMPGLSRKPRLGTIACGEPILAEQNIEGYDTVPDYIKCDFTLLCQGDSMINARIYDGDIVCIRQQEEVENGQIAAVLIDGIGGGEATLKRVRYTDNGVILWPENPAYEPLTFFGEDAARVHILGLATHFISVIR